MTNEMKENIIKYLTGNINEESYDPNLIYGATKTIVTNLHTQLSNEFPDGYDANNILQGKNVNGNELNYSVMYGTYTDSNSNTRGYLAIIDEYGNLIQIITEFTSGVKIGEIYTLNVDENGYFYMVENSVTNNAVRFVMLNNIVVKRETDVNYVCKIRKAYSIPSTSLLYTSRVYKIVKAVGQAKYCIFGERNSTGQFAYQYPMATELTINVGTENEWKDYDGVVWEYEGNQDSVSVIDTYATWNGDTINFVILAFPSTYIRTVVKYVKANNQSMSYSNISLPTGTYVNHWMENAIILNDTKAYFAMSYKYAVQDRENHRIYELDLTNNTSNEIAYQSGDFFTGESERLHAYILDKIGSEIFFVNTYTVESGTINKYSINMGRIRNDNYYTNIVSEKELIQLEISSINEFYLGYVNKQFNYYNFNLLLDNNTYNTYQIYNANNYNGTSIEGIRSLQPNSGILYDENDNIIFARNLYNRVITGGTTVSTLEVPNLYINNITIAKQDLLSYNNNILIDNSQDVITNQYETLDINFINTISMINRNDINNPVTSEIGASRLNNSMSNDVDYSNAKLTRIRLNYSDTSAFEKPIEKANQISTYVYQYEFTVYVPLEKDLISIDLLSADGNTTYTTIELSGLINGNTYKINQNVEIQ